MLRSSDTRRKVLIIALALLILAALVGVIAYSLITGSIAEEKKRQYELEIEDLLIERDKLNQQYSHMEQTVKKEMDIVPNSNITLVFLGAESELYTEVYPAMTAISSQVTGTVCFTETELPGAEGCLSLEQLDALAAQGWSYAVLFEGDGAEALAQFIDNMRKSLAKVNVAMPDTVVCRAGSYSPELDDTLIAEGIKNVVHNAEWQTARIDKTVDGELFHPGAVGWCADEMQRYFMAELMQYGGCACFTIELNATSADINLDMDNDAIAATFGRMIEAIDGWVTEGLVTARDVGFGHENRRLYIGTFEMVTSVVAQRRAEIQVRLDEIELEIAEIYRKYR